MTKQNIRVVIVDDHPVVRKGLKSLLLQYPEINVIGESDGNKDVLGMIGELNPDVVLMDIRLGNVSGIDLTRRIRRFNDKIYIIILTSYDEKSYLIEAIQAGAHGYLLKSASPETLVETIQEVYAGERCISIELVGQLMEQMEVLTQEQQISRSGLSVGEIQVLQMIADGLGTQEIAQALFLSESTVKRKLHEILEKLGATNRAQAIAEAFKRGLL